MRCPYWYPSKHQHIFVKIFVKIFLELPGTKTGPKMCLSQCLIIIFVTQYTQHKTGDFAFFSYSLSQPLSSLNYWAPFCSLYYTFSSILCPPFWISIKTAGEISPCSERLFPSPLFLYYTKPLFPKIANS